MASLIVQALLDLLLIPIMEPAVVIVEAVLKVLSIVIILITWIPEILKLTLEILNPVKLVNDGINGVVLSAKILFKNIENSISNVTSSKYDKCKDNGSGLFGLKRTRDATGKITGNNGKKCVPPTMFRLILMILCPPLALFLKVGIKGWFQVLISIFLTVFCFYFPGLLYVVMHVLC